MSLPVLRHTTHLHRNYAQEHRVSQVLILATVFLLCTVVPPAFAIETAWDEAVTAVLEDDSNRAISRLQGFLEAAPSNDDRRPRAVRWLSMMQQNAGDRERAKETLATYSDDTTFSNSARGTFKMDLANLYSESGELATARNLYGEAISLDPTLLAAYLNRANVQVREERREQAIRDYERYLSLNPQASQAGAVREMIRVLREAVAAEQVAEEMRQAAERVAEEERREREAEEERRRAEEAEAARLAEEQQQREEEERRQAEEEAARVAAEEQERQEAARRESERIAAEEREREEAARREAERIAAEEQERATALARAEAERAREEMLQSVMESLGGARRESRAFGLDAEDIRIDEDEIDLR